jgi:hypothetical protein
LGQTEPKNKFAQAWPLRSRPRLGAVELLLAAVGILDGGLAPAGGWPYSNTSPNKRLQRTLGGHLGAPSSTATRPPT